jgi:hypothetical protein
MAALSMIECSSKIRDFSYNNELPEGTHMKIEINSTTSIYDLVKEYPEVKEVMAELGFTDIVKPGMLQSVGRVMTLEKGARMKSVDWATIVAAFDDNGYTLTKGDQL